MIFIHYPLGLIEPIEVADLGLHTLLTRYDEDAYLVIEIDTKAGAHRPMNLDLVEWNTHFSRPYLSVSKG